MAIISVQISSRRKRSAAKYSISAIHRQQEVTPGQNTFDDGFQSLRQVYVANQMARQ